MPVTDFGDGEWKFWSWGYLRGCCRHMEYGFAGSSRAVVMCSKDILFSTCMALLDLCKGS